MRDSVIQSGLRKTERGFDYIELHDADGVQCSLQKSSITTGDLIWLGADDANPRILAQEVRDDLTGWVRYPVPDGVSMTTRMHLSRDQVRALLPYLTRFVVTGEIRVSNIQERVDKARLEGVVI